MEKDQSQKDSVTAPGVLEKYMCASKITKKVLDEVISKCVDGANIMEICEYGDNRIEEESTKIYKKKKFERGVAFPTCLSVNEICGHFSPLKSSDPVLLKTGDVVKIDLGAQIDGFLTLQAHTIVIGEEKVTGKKADVIKAAYDCMQAAVRLLKPGNYNNQITKNIAKVCEAYEVNPVEGVLSHELMRHLIDGNNVIINKDCEGQRVSDVEFQVNQIYALDCIVTSGEGKLKESEFRNTVFKRALDSNFDLKTKSARKLFGLLNKRFPSFAFSLRAFDDEIMARAGSNECAKHRLLDPYPVLIEQNGKIVAQFKWTVLISSKRIILLTHKLLDLEKFESDKVIKDEELKELLNIDLDSISKKKKYVKKTE